MNTVEKQYAAWDEREKKTGPLFGGCLQYVVVGIITCLVFLGCNDSVKPGVTPIVTPPIVDSTKPIDTIVTPHGDSIVYDTLKMPQMSLIGAAMAPATYAIKIEDIGVSPSNTAEQNSTAWEKFHNELPVGAAPSIYAKMGDYHFSKTMLIDSRPIHLIGDNGSPYALGTRFIFHDCTGIQIERNQGYQGTILQWIYVMYQGQTGNNHSGISIRARATVFECGMKGFPFNGLEIYANMTEGTDASGSMIFHCFSLENGQDGFFAGRVDANAISFISCDHRDNGRCGMLDDSMLGNYFFGCMGHNNKSGSYYVRDKANARSTFIACYAEEGDPPSELSPKSTVIGGLFGSGYRLEAGGEVKTGNYQP